MLSLYQVSKSVKRNSTNIEHEMESSIETSFESPPNSSSSMNFSSSLVSSNLPNSNSSPNSTSKTLSGMIFEIFQRLIFDLYHYSKLFSWRKSFRYIYSFDSPKEPTLLTNILLGQGGEGKFEFSPIIIRC